MARMDDTMLMAYVDGEVDAVTAREIEAAIAADPVVALRARAMRNSAVMARAAFADSLHEPVPDRLLQVFKNVETVASPAAGATNVIAMKPRAAAPRRAIIGLAMAASVAALVIGYGAGSFNKSSLTQVAGLQNTAVSERWLDNVAGFYNVYDSSLNTKDKMLVDFTADDAPELENYFGAKLNRKLTVPDLSASGFTAQGGRLLIVGGKPAAQFLYTSADSELVGIAIAFTDAPYLPAQTAKRGDVNIVHWRNNGYAYAFAGKLEPERLQELADRVWRDLERAS